MFYAKAILSASWLAMVAAQQEGYLGFNSGATLANGRAKQLSDYEEEFQTAANLRGAPEEFNSVRLYTNVQAGTVNTPTSAFEAAINTGTTMLLGLWCSGTDSIANELAAMEAALERFGDRFADLVVGISVGSEDLYRTSVTGINNEAGIGNYPDQIIAFIEETRQRIANTPLADKPVGHVDTSSAFFNESNAEVIASCDFIGMDAYPYYEKEKDNAFENARELWEDAYRKTLNAAGDVEVWITEIGWPVSGPEFGDATASIENAQDYWADLGCSLFGKVNTWWYTLRDSNPANEAKFAITENLSTTPRFDLTCPEGSRDRPLLENANTELDDVDGSITSLENDDDDGDDGDGDVDNSEDNNSEDDSNGLGGATEANEDSDSTGGNTGDANTSSDNPDNASFMSMSYGLVLAGMCMSVVIVAF